MNGKDIIMLIRTDPERGHRVLFDEYKNYVYAIVYNRLRNVAAREDIEECVGDTFADICIGIEHEHKDVRELSGYINTIAKRKAIKYYHRLTDTKKFSEELSDELAADTDVPAKTEMNERNREMLRIIMELGEPDCTIILLRYYYKRNSSEIAKKTGLRPATVRKRLERALNKLRIALTAAGITDKEEI